jgi:hypothetical protein
MQTLLVQIESPTKAKELTSMLTSMDFVKNVSKISKKKQLIEALQEHDMLKSSILKNKNKAFAKYL